MSCNEMLYVLPSYEMRRQGCLINTEASCLLKSTLCMDALRLLTETLSDAYASGNEIGSFGSLSYSSLGATITYLEGHKAAWQILASSVLFIVAHRDPRTSAETGPVPYSPEYLAVMNLQHCRMSLRTCAP